MVASALGRQAAFQLEGFAEAGLTASLLEQLIAEHEQVALPRLMRLWNYYRNALAEPDDQGGSRGSPQQAAGLPPRLKARRRDQDDRIAREVVIENDIAWRLHTLVDFMFPDELRIRSLAADAAMRTRIEAALAAVIQASGGVRLWQDAALVGSIYGSVDFLLNVHEAERRGASGLPGAAPSEPLSAEAVRAASLLSIETVEAPRAIPLVSQDDYRRLDAYVIHFQQLGREIERASMLSRILRALTPAHCGGWGSSGGALSKRESLTITQIHSAARSQRYEDGKLVDERINRLARLPVVHVQNLSQPLVWHGLSDVEPLIPLQDELNTRISDRANRVTMQSFRMYLGKGIEGFTDRPVGPGQMWMTDNLEASIEAFGGDADSPSERQHIEELREALDKASGVTPAAAGHIKARIGNLTSENALRISLMGTLAKIKRKRVTYGAGIAELCELILHALHVHGLLHTSPAGGERRVEIAWPEPLPIDESRRLNDALLKAKLGVPLEALRAELGYAVSDVNAPFNPGASK